MALKNYTTEIDASKTIGEIQGILSKFGISAIQIEYDAGQPVGLKFSAFLLGKPQWFHLQCNADAVLTVLRAEKVPPKFQTKEQAFRVGWRILKDLIDAQLASVAIRQVELAQAFLGFAIDNKGKTAYAAFMEVKQKQLTSGQE